MLRATASHIAIHIPSSTKGRGQKATTFIFGTSWSKRRFALLGCTLLLLAMLVLHVPSDRPSTIKHDSNLIKFLETGSVSLAKAVSSIPSMPSFLESANLSHPMFHTFNSKIPFLNMVTMVKAMQAGYDFDDQKWCGGGCPQGRAAAILDYMESSSYGEPPLISRTKLNATDLLAGFYGVWPNEADLKARLLLCTMAKNEDSYWLEWIQHYFLAGFERLRIYDNDSLQPPYWLWNFFPKHKVEIIDWPSKTHFRTDVTGNIQMSAERDCFAFGKQNGYDAVSLLDVDEFIVTQSLGERVDEWYARAFVPHYYPHRQERIAFPFEFFTFGGKLFRDKSLSVIESYQERVRDPFNTHSHVFGKWALLTARDSDSISLNVEDFSGASLMHGNPLLFHYRTRSFEEYLHKIWLHQTMMDINYRSVTLDFFSVDGRRGDHSQNTIEDSSAIVTRNAWLHRLQAK